MASCEICSMFDNHDLGESSEVPLTKIFDAGKRGCRRCSIFGGGIQICVPNLELSWICCAVIVPFSSCTLYLSPPEAEDVEEEVEFFVSEGELNPHSLPLRNVAQYDTSSKASLDIAKEWFQACSDSHIHCLANLSKPFPTRILEIVHQGTCSNVRLCENKSGTGRYIAVSHCWGGGASIELTRRKVGDYKKEIVWSILPQLFRDIVSFAASLSIQYIWIDSLCIIQDDRSDWHRESMKMLSVYQNAWLTIAATKSPNDRDSLFSERPVHKLTIPYGDNTADVLVSRRIFHHHDGLPSSHESSDPNQFPLLSRAWVFQERLLSPRILHFNSDEISWDCNEIATCVCQGCIQRGLKQNHSRLLGASIQNYTLDRTWRVLVRDYSSLELTEKSDRLPAIAGLARQIEPLRTGKYLAGLWSDSFFIDLLWSPGIKITEKLKPRPERSFAPSWSWASVDNKVHFDRCGCINTANKTYTTYCRMIGTKYPSLSSEYLTDLQGSYITLSGLGVRRKICYETEAPEVASGVQKCKIKIAGINYQYFFNDYNLFSGGPGRVEENEPVILFLIHANCRSESAFYDYCLVDHFLVLRSSKVVDGYERIGIVESAREPSRTRPTWISESSEMTVTIY